MTYRNAALEAAAACSLAVSGSALGAQQESLRVEGLVAPVEIVADRWGIAHIYAENEHDLFFAQGYSMVRVSG